MLNIKEWTEENQPIGVVVGSFLAQFLEGLKVEVVVCCIRTSCNENIERWVCVSTLKAIINVLESDCG